MPFSAIKNKPWLWIALAVAVVAFILIATGEDGQAPRSGRTLGSGANGGAYLRSVAATLNDLGGNVDLELQPAQPILTASTSADGNEVRATCTENPNSPDGSFTYMLAADGNANFYSAGVEPGDIVRYYVNVDEESAERGIEQRTALQLTVRRLDARDPENALIIEEGLNAPAVVPARIEIWRYSDKRMDAIRSALNRYAGRRLPAVGWEPAPDLGALQQIVERANQWFRNQPAAENWNPRPMVAEALEKMPEPATDVQRRADAYLARLLSPENLRDGVFADWEGRLLAQAVWCRDIGQWARGSAASDAEVAAALFDWTIRNVALDPPGGAQTIHHPWQALVYGHGSDADRAWVFIELLRQQRIDAVVLRPAVEGEAGADASLLVGALVGEELQLFDPKLGLPLPGPGEGAGTLAEIAADDALLRQLDVEGEYQYSATAEQFARVEAFVVAAPLQLSRRSELLEGALEGEDFVKLAADPHSLAERLKPFPQVSQVGLWTEPFAAVLDEQTISDQFRPQAVAEFAPLAERPLLWKARVLHFQGNKPPRAEERNDPLAQPRDGHNDALKLYQNRSVRPADSLLVTLEPDKRAVYSAAKADASYWLGLLCFDLGSYDIAATWLGDRTLEESPEGTWANAARYNLARTHEAMGNTEEAIELLEGDPKDAPQRHGNLLRAKGLAEAAP